jgi:hypothetical protein
MDFVVNHTSTSTLFKAAVAGDPKYKDYYVWSDTDPGLWALGAETLVPGFKRKVLLRIFWDQMPDLNYHNPAVTDEIQTASVLAGPGRGRLQGGRGALSVRRGRGAAGHQGHHPVFQDWRAFYTTQPQAFTVGEVWTDCRSRPIQPAKGLDSLFMFDLARTSKVRRIPGTPHWRLSLTWTY